MLLCNRNTGMRRGAQLRDMPPCFTDLSDKRIACRVQPPVCYFPFILLGDLVATESSWLTYQAASRADKLTLMHCRTAQNYIWNIIIYPKCFTRLLSCLADARVIHVLSPVSKVEGIHIAWESDELALQLRWPVKSPSYDGDGRFYSGVRETFTHTEGGCVLDDCAVCANSKPC